MQKKGILEKLLGEADVALRTLFPRSPRTVARPNPAQNLPEAKLTEQEKSYIASLMRVNHSGEVCAQALYRSQAFAARGSAVKGQLEQAAKEEEDHLAWCEQRLGELSNRPSRLNFFWYTGSFLIGLSAGLAGDKWSLGFLAETEHQVAKHLQKHLKLLPVQDEKTKAILTQMEEDERHHEAVANQEGAVPLPFVVKKLMKIASKVMTSLSFYL